VAATTYRDLFRIAGLPALTGVTVLSRLGGTMWSLALVLFVLERFHSAPLAGLATFFSWVPGLLVSPVAGALLDRHGRVRLIALDLGVAAATAGGVVGLDRLGILSPLLLVTVVAVGSITLPLTSTGTRALMPLLTPRPLWERINAVDSGAMNAAQFLGPALAGVLFAWIGGQGVLLVIGATWLCGLAVVAWVREPAAARPVEGSLFREAVGGLRYTFANPVLRGIALVIPLGNLGAGAFIVALPVMVLSRTHGGAAAVGALWSAFGVAGLVAGLLFGRVRTEGREREIMAVMFALSGAGLMVVATSALVPTTLVLAGAGMVVAGATVGPGDVAMFSLRQRATAPEWFGRALSVSMSLNALGLPVGSAVAGPIVAVSPVAAMVAGAALSVAAAGLALLVLPGRSRA
jgi:predicted MFS family arabinose efflux permease